MPKTIQAEGGAAAALLRALVDEVRTLPDVWQKIPEAQQQQIIDRLSIEVRRQTRELLRAVAAMDFGHFDGSLESLTVKDGVKAVLKLPAVGPLEHLLAQVGGSATLVIASSDALEEGLEKVRADADQPDLPLEDELPEDTDPGVRTAEDVSMDVSAGDPSADTLVEPEELAQEPDL